MRHERNSREQELLDQYEAPGTAEHYAVERWSQSRRARRSSAKEKHIINEFCREAGRLSRILDLPCGAGRFNSVLSAHCDQVVSADLSGAMLSQSAGDPAFLIRASAASIPFGNGSFDLINCFRLLHHFEFPEQRVRVLKELARTSRHWATVSFFDSGSFQAWRNRVRNKPSTRYPQTINSFIDEAAQAGWNVKRLEFMSRGISEQVLALLEKKSPAEKNILDLPSVRLSKRQLSIGKCVARKHYFFPRVGPRIEAGFRHTWSGQCRAQQEFENLKRLAELGVPVVVPLTWWCRRDSFGFVRDSFLETEWLDAPNAEQVEVSARRRWIDKYQHELEQSIAQVHESGCLYRGLHPRNLLLAETGPVWLDPAKCRWFEDKKNKKFISLAADERMNFWEQLHR